MNMHSSNATTAEEAIAAHLQIGIVTVARRPAIGLKLRSGGGVIIHQVLLNQLGLVQI